MSLIIDSHETLLIQLLPKHTVKTLDVGDIHIVDELGNMKIVIERKTIADLRASILDSRYTEQSYRLRPLLQEGIAVFYLIEGSIPVEHRKMICSAMFSLAYYKRFNIIRSWDINETAFILTNMLAKFIDGQKREKKRMDAILNTPVVTEDLEIARSATLGGRQSNYAHAIKMVKKDNMTPDVYAQLVLAQIPGVSVNTAQKLLTEYGTVSNLKSMLLENEHLLDTFKVNGRKISGAAVKALAEFLTVL